jgi:hypothetical protein
MTIALTAALFTIAAIAFAVAAETMFRTLATVSVMFDYLSDRLSALEDEWIDDTDIDDDDDDEIDEPTEPWERDPEAWKHQ